MKVTDALVKLRDELKNWTAYNILQILNDITEIKKNISEINKTKPVKISDLEQDIPYVNETKITLGINSDGLLYVFINGRAVGTGISIDSGDTTDNLLNSGELYLNQRYSMSGGGLISDSVSNGIFSIIAPLESSKTNHTLEFYNLKMSLENSSRSCMYLLDANKENPTTVNGNSLFSQMTSGVIEHEDGKNASVIFNSTSDAKYIVISIQVQTTAITRNDIADYIIHLI